MIISANFIISRISQQWRSSKSPEICGQAYPKSSSTYGRGKFVRRAYTVKVLGGALNCIDRCQTRIKSMAAEMRKKAASSRALRCENIPSLKAWHHHTSIALIYLPSFEIVDNLHFLLNLARARAKTMATTLHSLWLLISHQPQIVIVSHVSLLVQKWQPIRGNCIPSRQKSKTSR